jgi:S1-C subfamily serine protease
LSAPLPCLALALGLLASPPAPSPPAPSPPSSSALKRAAEAGGRAWVRVEATTSGPGVLVGADGQVLTVGYLLTGDSALVKVAGTQRPARLLQRLPTLGLVLLGVEGEGPFEPPAARLEPPSAGEWVVSVGEAGSAPALGRVTRGPSGPWFEVSLRLVPGSPVLDGKGQLLGIATARRRSGTRVAALPAVRMELQGGGAGR